MVVSYVLLSYLYTFSLACRSRSFTNVSTMYLSLYGQQYLEFLGILCWIYPVVLLNSSDTCSGRSLDVGSFSSIS